MINRFFITLLCVFLVFNSNLYSASTGTFTQASTNKQTDLSAIDAQIESLENLKQYYISKAKRLRSKGDRAIYSSFEDNRSFAEKYWKSANNYDKISDEIQEEINNLEKERKLVEEKSDY